MIEEKKKEVPRFGIKVEFPEYEHDLWIRFKDLCHMYPVVNLEDSAEP